MSLLSPRRWIARPSATQTRLQSPGHRHVYHQYTIRAQGDREAFAAALRADELATVAREVRALCC
jgi:dTDP-4-amino-4,6-dideoxygalactose transaminase